MHSVLENLRFAYRRLRNSPGFTLTVVLTLTLGIGATTSIFSLIEGVLLRPLPYRDPDRLVLLGDHLGGGPGSGISVTAREIATYAKATRAFSSMGGYLGASYELSDRAASEEVNAVRLSAGVFPTLGVLPHLGRTFSQAEEEAHQPVVVLSDSLWRRRYHGDPEIIGTAIVLDRKAYTIIGVMPRDFEFPLSSGPLDRTDLWVPLSLSAEELSYEHTGFWGYHQVARLKDGVSFSQAGEDANRVAAQVMRDLPASQSQIRIEGRVMSLLEHEVGDARPLLRMLFLAVSVVLLIGCVNVAGLLLVRAIRRRSEYAVRLALGARTAAIVRESVFEGLMLGGMGGVFGLGFDAVAIRAALNILPDSLPRAGSIGIDGTVVAFAVLLSLATGALCSLLPAIAALRVSLTESLQESQRTGTGSSSHSWLRSALVVSEIAIALVLLTAAGAFLRSFQKMQAVDPGFRGDHVLLASYQLPLQQYSTKSSALSFSRNVVDRLRGKPGVLAVGLTDVLPASGMYGGSGYTLEGQTAADWELKLAMFSTTYSDYFSVMKIRLLAGRYFNEDDRENAPPVVIVNESMAQSSWPGQQALGKRLHLGGPNKKLPWATVVGVVANTKLGSLDEPDQDQLYLPAEQPGTLEETKPGQKLSGAESGYITLRTMSAPEQAGGMLRASVAEIDPQLALQQLQPMAQVVSEVEAPRLFNTDLIGTFAITALVLAIVGVYAVVAFSVALRSREIAVRMALGSQRENILKLILGWSAKLALLGCVLGVVGSLAASRLLSSFLFEVSATDPGIYAASALLMVVLTLVASALPAARAALIDPIIALRSN